MNANSTKVQEMQGKMTIPSNTLRAGVFIGLGVLAIVIGVALSPSAAALKEGFRILLTTSALLDSPSFYLVGDAGLGVPFINSGILLILVMVSYLMTKVEVKGSSIPAAFMVFGFGFGGKTILNVWPTLFGVLLYAIVNKKKINTQLPLAWFSSALAPMINILAMYTRWDGKNTMSETPIFHAGRILVAVVVGVIAGYLVAVFAGFLAEKHNGLTLYNAGFAAGLTGFLIFSLMKAMGFGHAGPSHVYPDDKDLVLGACLCILLAYLLVCGLWLWKRAGGDIKTLVTGKSSGCSVEKFGFGATLVNMSICGYLCLIYTLIFTVAGHAHAPLFASLFTVVGFASNGISVRTMAPIMAGVYVTSIVVGGVQGWLTGGDFLSSGLTYVGSKSLIIAAIFGCGLSPVVYKYGALVGFVIGCIHSLLVVNVGSLHGWMSLYNNGFCLGLVATFFVPAVVALLRADKDKVRS